MLTVRVGGDLNQLEINMFFAQSDSSDWGVGQVFWSLLWFFLFMAWIVLVIRIFSDIMRARSMSGGAKALWTIAIILVPFLGVFFYLIANGDDMNRRAAEDAQAANDAMDSYIRDTANAGANPGEQLQKVADLHKSGALNDAEYEKAKAKIIGD